MTHQRIFNFPIATLTGEARRLLGALRDTVAGPAVMKRLKTGYDVTFETQIALVEKGGTDKSTAGGASIQLTQEQAEAYTNMEQLMSGARHTASLIFPRGDSRLTLEFSVGLQEQSHDLDHELQYAANILKGCGTYAAQMAGQGWTADDTTALSAAIDALKGDPDDRDNTDENKKLLTSARNTGANQLYQMCLGVQNAARLAYPAAQIGKTTGVAEARDRFLLNSFPPARSSDSPPPAPSAPTTPAK